MNANSVNNDSLCEKEMNKMWNIKDETPWHLEGGVGGGRLEVQLKDTISAWKQHTTPDHFSHDAANRPDINWKN